MHAMVLFVLAGVVGAAAFPARAAEFYVAPSGNDAEPGTRAKPFATLERARDAVRAIKAKGMPAGGVTVWLRGGTYERKQTFELGRRDSGTRGAPIVYRAVKGEDVRLAGGSTLPGSAFKPVTDKAVLARLPEEARGKVLVCDLKARGITDLGRMKPFGFGRPVVPPPLEVIFNDRVMQLARWPNAGFAKYGKILDPGSVPRTGDKSNRGGRFAYEGDRPARWAKAKELYLFGYWAYQWADEALPVKSIDTRKREITLALPHVYGLKPHGGSPVSRERPYYALNLLAELDAAGEYYVARHSGKLFFLPPSDPERARVVVTVLADPLIMLNEASHVILRGLTLEASRGMGVLIVGGTGNRVAGCTLRNLGTAAVCVGNGAEPRRIGSLVGRIYGDTAWNRNAGSDNGVLGCDIHHIGAAGVYLGGGDRKTLAPGRNFVSNCDIHSVGTRYRQYQPPVQVDGAGNRVSDCHLHHVPGNGVWLWGNDHVIERNEIDHCAREADDSAAIGCGRDPSMQGNVIRHNLFHHNGGRPWTSDLFFDDGHCGHIVTGNIFCGIPPRGALFIHAGLHHRFENNIVVGGTHAVKMRAWNQNRWNAFLSTYEKGLIQRRLYRAVDIRKPPYSARYPNLKVIAKYAPSSNAVQGNLLFRCRHAAGGGPVATSNVIAKDDPGFTDAERMDFRLKKDAAILKKLPKLAEIPFEKIGPQDDEFRSLPKELFHSKLLRGRQEAGQVEISVSGVHELHLIVDDGGDNNWSDHADWAAAELVSKDGSVTRLSAMTPVLRFGYAGGLVKLDRTYGGRPLAVGAKTFEHGISTHADSEIHYRLDGRFKTFRAWIGVDNTSLGKGSVRFRVSADMPGKK